MRRPIAHHMGSCPLASGVKGGIILSACAHGGGIQITKGSWQGRKSRLPSLLISFLVQVRIVTSLFVRLLVRAGVVDQAAHDGVVCRLLKV